MNSKILISIVVVLVVAVGAWWVWGRGSSNMPTTPQAQNEEHVLQGSKTASGDLDYKENAQYYTIDAVYPGKTPLANSDADHRARITMEQGLKDAITQFKKDGNFAHLTPHDVEVQGLGPDRKYSLQISYKPYQSPGYVSYVFSLYEDTLGAHPNGFYQTYTFNEVGEKLDLADLFKPGARYLDRISAEAQKQVLAQLKDRSGGEVTSEMQDEVRVGTSPTPETLQFFYLQEQNLHIIIPPYQAAAYAAGEFDVVIPLLQLKDILK
jgi:hypothetical protein